MSIRSITVVAIAALLTTTTTALAQDTNATDLSDLRAEIAQLKAELAELKADPQPADTDTPAYTHTDATLQRIELQQQRIEDRLDRALESQPSAAAAAPASPVYYTTPSQQHLNQQRTGLLQHPRQHTRHHQVLRWLHHLHHRRRHRLHHALRPPKRLRHLLPRHLHHQPQLPLLLLVIPLLPPPLTQLLPPLLQKALPPLQLRR